MLRWQAGRIRCWRREEHQPNARGGGDMRNTKYHEYRSAMAAAKAAALWWRRRAAKLLSADTRAARATAERPPPAAAQAAQVPYDMIRPPRPSPARPPPLPGMRTENGTYRKGGDRTGVQLRQERTARQVAGAERVDAAAW